MVSEENTEERVDAAFAVYGVSLREVVMFIVEKQFDGHERKRQGGEKSTDAGSGGSGSTERAKGTGRENDERRGGDRKRGRSKSGAGGSEGGQGKGKGGDDGGKNNRQGADDGAEDDAIISRTKAGPEPADGALKITAETTKVSFDHILAQNVIPRQTRAKLKDPFHQTAVNFAKAVSAMLPPHLAVGFDILNEQDPPSEGLLYHSTTYRNFDAICQIGIKPSSKATYLSTGPAFYTSPPHPLKPSDTASSQDRKSKRKQGKQLL